MGPIARLRLLAVLAGCLVFGPFTANALGAAVPGWGTAAKLTLPANHSASPQATLTSIGCTSPGNCVAVGDYWVTGASTTVAGLLATETNGTWAPAIQAPLPGGGSSYDVMLTSVSCTGDGTCVAAGSYSPGLVQPAPSKPLIETYANGTWTVGTVAAPSQISTTNPGFSLTGVSCASAGNCAVDGTFTDTSGHVQGALALQSGGVWAPAVEVPLPSNAYPANPGVSMAGISCGAPGNCSAVGTYNVQSGAPPSPSGNGGFIVSTTGGGSLTATAVAAPGGARGFVQYVSCGGSGSCTAVGTYGSPLNGLVVTETGGSWQPGVRIALPSDANGSAQSHATGVSCPAAGRCTISGSYLDTSGHTQAMAVDQNGSTLFASKITAPQDASGNPNASIGQLTCPSAGNCVATGTYNDQSGLVATMWADESGGAWSAATRAPLPGDAGTPPPSGIPGITFSESTLSAVSCGSAGGCGIAGTYYDSSHEQQAFTINPTRVTPTLTVTAPTTAIASAVISPQAISATIAGGNAPIGTATFTVFGPSASPPASCASGGTTVGPATVSGNGTFSPANGFIPPSAGNYWWYVSYAGDASDNAATSRCDGFMTETVVTANPNGGGSGSGGSGSGGSGSGGSGNNTATAGSPSVIGGSTVTDKITCPGTTGVCRVTLTLTVTETKRGAAVIALGARAKKAKVKKVTVVIGSQTVSVPAGHSQVVSVKLNGTGKRLLAKYKHLKATLTIKAGSQVLLTSIVKLSAPPKKHRR